MLKQSKQKSRYENILYNNILFLSRNRIFYTNFNLTDTFENRINLIFLHISFLFIKNKDNNQDKTLNIFQQKLFDLTFVNIELNMREIGFGDVTINKNMKSLVKIFYSILLGCESYHKMNSVSKTALFDKYLKLNNLTKNSDNTGIIDYFDKYRTFCFDLSNDSILKGDLNFNY